jgi:hypothetical protein
MPKLEPMSIEEIHKLVVELDWYYAHNSENPLRVCRRLILAWAEERADNNRLNWYLDHGGLPPNKRATDWFNAVLDEIGWPEDQRY